jgi:cytochrome c553
MRRLLPDLLRVCLVFLLAPLPLIGTAAVLERCAECHGTDGMGQDLPMVPVIAGIPAEHIEDAILSYVDGARSCAHEPRMCETVAMLSESQVTEVADYYAGKERGSSGQEFDRDLAARGALLYQQHCALCHLSPDSEDAAYAVGIPLHGQRLDYLRYAIEAYLGGDREAQFEAMMHELRELRPEDVDALVNHFASYRPGD